MKVLMILFIGAVALMGYYDGGDVTGAVVQGLLFLPGLMERNEKRGKRCNWVGNMRNGGRTEIQRTSEKAC